MEKVKVLHLVSSLWSGGVAVLLKNYYEHMDKNLIRFDFVVHSPVKGVTEEYFESVGSQIYRLPPMKNFCASFIGTYRIIKQNDYRIVHAHHTDVSFVQLFAAKCAGAKIRIAHSHDELFPKRLKEKIKRKLYCILTTMLSNYHFACSESAGRYVFGEQVNFSNYLYVHNAIDYEKFKFDQRKREEFRNKLGWNDCFVIGNVGRLVDQKNPFFTIEIFAKTLKKIPNASVVCSAFWGQNGVLVGTLVALSWRCLDTFLYSNKYIIRCSNKRFCKRLLYTLVNVTIFAVISFKIWDYVFIYSFIEWIIMAICISLIEIVVLFIEIILLERTTILEMLSWCKKMK